MFYRAGAKGGGEVKKPKLEKRIDPIEQILTEEPKDAHGVIAWALCLRLLPIGTPKPKNFEALGYLLHPKSLVIGMNPKTLQPEVPAISKEQVENALMALLEIVKPWVMKGLGELRHGPHRMGGLSGVMQQRFARHRIAEEFKALLNSGKNEPKAMGVLSEKYGRDRVRTALGKK